jgi:hypothetical protein
MQPCSLSSTASVRAGPYQGMPSGIPLESPRTCLQALPIPRRRSPLSQKLSGRNTSNCPPGGAYFAPRACPELVEGDLTTFSNHDVANKDAQLTATAQTHKQPRRGGRPTPYPLGKNPFSSKSIAASMSRRSISSATPRRVFARAMANILVRYFERNTLSSAAISTSASALGEIRRNS